MRIENNSGTGVFVNCGRPVFENVIITNNIVNSDNSPNGGSGAGVFVHDGAPEFRNVLIVANSVIFNNNFGARGGGVYIVGGSPVFEHSVIANNLAQSRQGAAGGGVYSIDASPIFRHVTIANNIVSAPFGRFANGGGVYLRGGRAPTPVFEDVTFFNNKASNDGDGIYVVSMHDGADFRIVSSNFVDNGYALWQDPNQPGTNAENVWWGDASGPFHQTQNPGGRGDTAHTFVDIAPFSTTPNVSAPPIPVRGLSLREKGNESVTLNWFASAMSDLAGYKISYTSSPDSLFPVRSTSLLTETEQLITGLHPDSTYYFYGVTVDTDGNVSWYSKALVVDMSVTFVSTEETPKVPIRPVVLEGNSPNPFHSSTTIEYSLLESGHVHLTVFDALGREISVLVDEHQSSGNHRASFMANELPSGLYFYRIRFGKREDVRPMVLIR